MKSYTPPYSIPNIIRIFAKDIWVWGILGGVFSLFSTVLILWIPSLIQQFVDGYLAPERPNNLRIIAVLIGIAAIVNFWSEIINRMSIYWVSRLISQGLREKYFDHVLRVDHTSSTTFSIGGTISRLFSDIPYIVSFLDLGMIFLLSILLVGSYTIYAMWTIHVGLTLAALLPLSAHILIYVLLRSKILAYATIYRSEKSHLTAKVTEAFHNIHSIKSQRALLWFTENIEICNQNLYHASTRLFGFSAILSPVLGFITGLGPLIVIGYGGYIFMNEAITLGEIAAFIAYLACLAVPIRGVAYILTQSPEIKSSLSRLKHLSQLPNEEHGKRRQAQFNYSSSPWIELNNISFRYAKAQTPTLSQLSVRAEKGEHIGIVGELGSGKSTLFALLTAIYRPDAGTYKLWKQDTVELAPALIRQEIGWVTQEHDFFSQSIQFNLALEQDMNDKAFKQRMVACTKQAAIYDEIMSFPEGFNTCIGEKGIKLSGGQKQRLSLARSLLHPKKIYLFDDIFSAVDYATESAMLEIFESLKHATLFIVSHRENVLRRCHRVVVLEGGRFARSGTYHELSAVIASLQPQPLSRK